MCGQSTFHACRQLSELAQSITFITFQFTSIESLAATESLCLGMGRYQYRYRKYRHIGTFFSIGSIGIGNQNMLQKLLAPENAVKWDNKATCIHETIWLKL